MILIVEQIVLIIAKASHAVSGVKLAVFESTVVSSPCGTAYYLEVTKVNS